MTEVTAGVPAQRTEYDPDQTDVALTAVPAEDSLEHVEPAAPSAPYVDDVSSGFREAVGDAGERVQTYAGEAGHKVQEFASDAAEKAGDYAEKAAEATGKFAGHVAERIRNNAELPADRGSTTIADEVVEKIAGIAAREVPGVYDLGGDVARVFAAVRDRIGLGEGEGESSNRGVQVKLEGRTAVVRVTLVIEYGFVLYSVAEKVRTKVIGSVENLLGLEVTAVDIVVDDVHVPESAPESAAPPNRSSVPNRPPI
jgi:uncharacterized alkaline shock family protein YloU